MVAKWSSDEMKIFTERARSGDLKSQIDLGRAYLDGDFVENDGRSAFFWFRQAADQGSKEAKYRLAIIMLGRRHAEGYAMLEELSDFPPALYELGTIYCAGGRWSSDSRITIKKDTDKAVDCWSRAADAGHLLAKIQFLKHHCARAKIYKKPTYIYGRIGAIIGNRHLSARQP